MDQGQPIAILAVDDEPGVLALVRRCLDDRHITLIEATSGKDALNHWANDGPIDLLLTDLRMPEMEGDELARHVRARQPDVKVLYLTSHADRLFGTTSQLEPGDAFLDKPFTREGLREAVALLVVGSTRLAPAPVAPSADKIRHDFKNQLAVIRGFADILLNESAATDPRRSDFEEIHKAAVRALELLEQMYPGEADSE